MLYKEDVLPSSVDLEYQSRKAQEAVLKAGIIILEGNRKGAFDIRYKNDGSPSTRLDREAEEEIRGILLAAFPTNSFTGEECGSVDGTDAFRWYCDPLDGTWCVINGENTAATSLALAENESTVLAVVCNPFTGELFSGYEGARTILNDEPIPRFNRTVPAEAVYNFQISPSRKSDVVELYSLWEQRAIAKLISRGGSIAYNLAQVAEGSHSVYIAASTKPSEECDTAAGVYLVRSVGGQVSRLDEGRVLIASTNPEIHQKTLDLLAQKNFGKRE